MWSAVPGVEDLSCDEDCEELSANCDRELVDGHEPETSKASFDNGETAPPRGCNGDQWQTFCKLKRRRLDSSQLGKAKKSRKSKKLAFSSVPPPPPVENLRDDEATCDKKTSAHSRVSSVETSGPSSSTPSSSVPTTAQQKHWDTLKRHLHVNEHIQQPIDHGYYNPNKSGLEKRLDQAVAEGDFAEADELSNNLATRDLACKIAKSADARDYLKWKEAEETKRKARRKKKKLNWGFEAKERWQMKGNM